MSHFLVFVVGEDVEGQLAPYHEFECTGRSDEWVESIDITESVRAEYETKTEKVVRLPDGSVVSPYEDKFFRDPTDWERAKLGNIFGSGVRDGVVFVTKDWGDDQGYRVKINDPTICGGELITLPVKELMTLAEYCKEEHGKPLLSEGDDPDYDGVHKRGWTEVEGGEVTRVITRTNPNKKWDWWTLGGRWAGFFKLKGGGVSDTSLLGEIDLEGMQKQAEDEARSAFKEWREVYQDHGAPLSWLECLENFKSHEKARAFYGCQEAIGAYRAKVGDYRCPVQTFGFDEEAYVTKERKSALVPFAVVLEGAWYEKGAMGWWCLTSNEKGEDAWSDEVSKLLVGLSPDTRVSAIDCHI